jgi:DNA-binding winged helix-turn-helix (wHTH) protein/Tol biopolymer transport system component
MNSPLKNPAESSYVFCFDEFSFDAGDKVLYKSEKIIGLAPKACELLDVFIKNAGKIIGKEELMNRVWTDSFVEEANLTHHISALRKALGEDKNGRKFIETIPRKGYRFVAEVKNLSNHAVEIIVSERTMERVVEEIKIDDAAEIGQTPNADLNLPNQTRRLSGDKFSVRRSIVGAVVLLTAFAAIGYSAYKFFGFVPTEFETGKLTLLTSTGKTKLAAISPDGRFVAHVQAVDGRESLFVRQVANQGNTQIIAAADVQYRGLSFSPDGSQLYYVVSPLKNTDKDLYRIPTLGGAPQKILSNLFSDNITFSPENNRFAFLRINTPDARQSVIIAGADGTNEQTLFVNSEPSVRLFASPAWSPDGKTIACPLFDSGINASFRILMINAAEKTAEYISAITFDNMAKVAWLPDSKHLLVLGIDETETYFYQIWLISTDGSERRRVSKDFNNYETFSIAADGKTLAAVRTELTAHLWTTPRGDVNGLRQISNGIEKYDGTFSLSWISDNRIFYASIPGGKHTLSSINADGSNLQQFPVGGEFAATSRDGRYAVYQRAVPENGRLVDYGLFLFDTADGSERRLTTGIDTWTDFSPDAKWVIFSRYGKTLDLWRVPTEGGEPVLITRENSPIKSAVSPDGKLIAALNASSSELLILPFDGGAPIKKFACNSCNIGSASFAKFGLQWTLDGRGVYFIRDADGVSNIWQQPVDGGAPVQVTDFTSDLIFNFAFSPDQSQIALSRGAINSDVVLIENAR